MTPSQPPLHPSIIDAIKLRLAALEQEHNILLQALEAQGVAPETPALAAAPAAPAAKRRVPTPPRRLHFLEVANFVEARFREGKVTSIANVVREFKCSRTSAQQHLGTGVEQKFFRRIGTGVYTFAEKQEG